jgi:hypothetical protein
MPNVCQLLLREWFAADLTPALLAVVGRMAQRQIERVGNY